MKKNHLILLIALTIGVSAIFVSCETEKPIPQTTNQSGQQIMDKGGEALQIKHIRKNAHEDIENLQILADAMEKMKDMSCDNPMSWYMQGAIHGAPFDSGGNIFCDSLTLIKAINPAWHNCTHEYDSLNLTDSDARTHFYTWHKFYINHFEDIIREVSGKPNFALPYWEYDNSNYQTLPPLFTDKSSSLYEAYRSDNMNSGKPIETSLGYKHRLDYQDVFDLTSPDVAFNAKSFHQFTRDLESVPHNVMHVYMGLNPTNQNPDPVDGGFTTEKKGEGKETVIDTTQWGYMYQNYSPLDPIFWVHHANIDRLYEKWLIEKIDDNLANGGRPAKDYFIQNEWIYNFFKAGDKELTFYSDLSDVFDTAYGLQDYAYDMFIENGLYNKAYENKVSKAIQNNTWGTSTYQTLELLVSTHNGTIPVGAGATPEATVTLDLQIPEIKNSQRETWYLRFDVAFFDAPQGVFSVLIKDKDIKEPKKGRAGTMTFFGQGHHSSSKDHVHDCDDPSEKYFQFDVTDKVNFNSFSGNMIIEIIPTNVKDKIIIDKIQLIKEVIVKK